MLQSKSFKYSKTLSSNVFYLIGDWSYWEGISSSGSTLIVNCLCASLLDDTEMMLSYNSFRKVLRLIEIPFLGFLFYKEDEDIVTLWVAFWLRSLPITWESRLYSLGRCYILPFLDPLFEELVVLKSDPNPVYLRSSFSLNDD